jgi:LuxR family maltose regulon positive regulatory protein
MGRYLIGSGGKRLFVGSVRPREGRPVPESWIDSLRLRATPPAVPPGFLERPRLDERLTAAASRPCTLLCAGPGHGKTLAVASWISHRTGEDVAWLSLDDTDNDPRAFWSDVLGALIITGSIPVDSPLREVSPAGRFDVNAARLISAGFAALTEPVVLVLDDFHVIVDGGVLRSFERLLDHQPPQLHIILTSRADPPLRLHRRRVAGKLTDIRAGELAFTATEAGQLLAGNGIHLTAAQLTALLDRTQGWAAGLRLAVLSLDAGDVDDVMERFTGNDGLVAEYLIEEVLDRVPAADRQFLLATSVTERISPQLADDLTGRTDSAHRLERLAGQNALVLELAGESGWFGFHPMLKELLLRRLNLEQPRIVGDLHRRAARWFGTRGDAVPAIRHAGQAKDWDLVGHLLATIAWPLALTPSGPALTAALEPAITVALQSPTAATLLAAAVSHYQRHDFPSMRRECDDAAKLIGDVAAADRVAVECLIGTLRIAHSRIVDPADTEGAAIRQLSVLNAVTGAPPPTAEHHRVIAANNLAVGQLWSGNLDEAASNLLAVLPRCRELGLGLTELSVHGHLALLDVIHGRLPAAAQRAGAALELADRRGWTAEPQALGLHTSMALVNVEQGRSAFSGSVGIDGLADSGADTDVACRLVLAIAAIEHAAASGDGIRADEAGIRLDEIQLRAGRLPPLLAGWCTAAHAAADLTAGRWNAAMDRVKAPGGPSPYSDALGQLVVAKARLLLDQPQQSIDALRPLLSAAPRFRGAAVEARILAAVAADRLHRDIAAMTAMTEAIALAHSVGMIRPFLTAGPRVASLLERHRNVVATHLEFTGQVVATLDADPLPRKNIRPLVEPLTEREMAVLVYLPTMLKSAEIASELFLSVNTVKTHQRAIYRKLGVGNRRAAVNQARALNMLEQPDRSTLPRVRRTS